MGRKLPSSSLPLSSDLRNPTTIGYESKLYNGAEVCYNPETVTQEIPISFNQFLKTDIQRQ